MPRKLVYRLGIFAIFVAVSLSPASYLLFGTVEKAKVIEIAFKYHGGMIMPLSTYPKLQFYYHNKGYIIYGDENQECIIGEEVKVIFFKNNPDKAIVLSFGNLFIESIIELPIGLLIWWALFKSYPTLFEPERKLLWFENFLYRKKPKNQEFKISEAPLSVRVLIYTSAAITMPLFLYAIWKIYEVMVAGELSYQTGLGLSAVIILILLIIIQKIRKG